jgi:hypothetical protein
MKRIDALEARRRALLERCDQQRVELAYHVAQIGPATQLARWTHRAAQWREGGPGVPGTRHYSVALLAAVAALVALGRSRKLISWLGWITGAISLASRAARIMRLFSQLRALRSGMR